MKRHVAWQGDEHQCRHHLLRPCARLLTSYMVIVTRQLCLIQCSGVRPASYEKVHCMNLWSAFC